MKADRDSQTMAVFLSKAAKSSARNDALESATRSSLRGSLTTLRRHIELEFVELVQHEALFLSLRR